MSLIGTGAFHRQQAMQGLGAASQLEAQNVAARQQYKSAEEAAEMQNLSQGAGIGASYGLMKLANAPGAEAVTTIAAPVGSTLGGASAGSSVSGLGMGIAEGSSAPGVLQTLGGEAATGFSGGLSLAPEAAIGADGIVAGNANLAAGAGTSGAGAGAGASGSGLMAGLGTIAAPLAIGLGVAFLLNKLFD